MDFWEYSEGLADVKSKPRVRNLCALVHKLFRQNLGFVDQGDVKATVMKITAEQTPKWHQNQIRFLIESTISACHGNYNLDSSTGKPEFFTKFYNNLMVELLEASKSYRRYKCFPRTPDKKRMFQKGSQGGSSHKKQKITPVQHQKGHTYGRATMAGKTCTARGNLAACIRKVKERRKCKFCGKRSVDLYHCNACGEYFCLKSPTQLIIPGSNPPRHFRIDGPFCWHLVHGYSNWNECAP